MECMTQARHSIVGAMADDVAVFVFVFFYFPLNKHGYNIFNKISTVKKEWKGHKYSNLIICPLIKYIYFRIKRKLEKKE